MAFHQTHGVSRRTLLLVAVGALAAGAIAATPAMANKPPVFTGLVQGVAVGGYDPVAYFSQGAAVEGDPAITTTYDGAEWRFSSTENRDAFLANPARYAPQFGGYCAWAVSEGYTAKGDPRHWQIVDGKLYLNFNGRIHRRWQGDIPGHIASATRNWPNVLAD